MRHTLHYVFIAGENFANFMFLRRITKYFSVKINFKQLDTALVGVVHWDSASSQRYICKIVFSSNS